VAAAQTDFLAGRLSNRAPTPLVGGAARVSSFEYRISTGGGNPCSCDILKSNAGRMISFIVTKEW